MSEVVKLDSDEWEATTDLKGQQLLTKIQFAGSPIAFFVNGQCFGSDHNTYYELRVTPERKSTVDQVKYLIEYQVSFSSGFPMKVGAFKETYETCACLNVCYVGDQKVSIKLSWKKVAPFYGMNADLKTYIERGATVTLVGSDGSVSVPKRLLKMWSVPLEAMFNHDTQEKRTGQIKMEEYNTKTLTAFKQFLMTGKVEDGKETVLDLFLLAGKYDIQVMKKAAEEYVTENIRELDEEEKLDIFSKFCIRHFGRSPDWTLV